MLRRIPWREVCKFLSGAFFVSAGVLLYLYVVDVSVPVGSFILTPKVHLPRSIAHYVFFAITFYLGFIRK
ncbi:hypothetical protein BH09MYX1_BH09MYX1_09660 [soil metagenome]